jgi:NAD+ synthase (glutamine-hydrolysing)
VEGREVIPASVLAKEPLRRASRGPARHGLAAPYEVLDPILEAYIEEDKGVAEIVRHRYDEDDVDASWAS